MAMEKVKKFGPRFYWDFERLKKDPENSSFCFLGFGSFLWYLLDLPIVFI